GAAGRAAGHRRLRRAAGRRRHPHGRHLRWLRRPARRAHPAGGAGGRRGAPADRVLRRGLGRRRAGRAGARPALRGGLDGRGRHEPRHDLGGPLRRGAGHGRGPPVRAGRAGPDAGPRREGHRPDHRPPAAGRRRAAALPAGRRAAGTGAVSARIFLATGNPHKVEEVQHILGPAWRVEGRDPGVEETGETFEENALIKARAVAAATGEVAIADDSGIEIDALGGAPGVRSARWAAEGDWIPRVLRELEGVPDERRTCRYVCAAAVVWPGPAPREMVVRGTVEGVVAHAPRGTGGFGYDPIMVPVEGDGRTFAEMT